MVAPMSRPNGILGALRYSCWWFIQTEYKAKSFQAAAGIDTGMFLVTYFMVGFYYWRVWGVECKARPRRTG